jgi:hypothetical protein
VSVGAGGELCVARGFVAGLGKWPMTVSETHSIVTRAAVGQRKRMDLVVIRRLTISVHLSHENR